MSQTWYLAHLFDIKASGNDTDDQPGGGAPPGTPPTYKYEGPWFSTQLILALSIGVVSFLLFSYCRKRWPVLYAPRTKLKGFSPHEAHAHQAFFGWIMPTIRTSEYTILQIVGLDAAVMLNFFKMSFYLFFWLTLFAMAVIMPINLKTNLSIWGPDDDGGEKTLAPSTPPPTPWDRWDWLNLVTETNAYHSLQLISTYIITFTTLHSLHKNYKQFIRSRQLYSLEFVHSIPARTVMVQNLPPHLKGERSLAVYFEHMGLNVESVSVCREVGSLSRLLEKRTEALLKLEKAWVDYVGNPSTVENYDPSSSIVAPLVDIDMESQQPAARLVVPHRNRPTLRPGFFKPKVDALEYLEAQFNEHDEAVRKKRKTGKFKASSVAFVTFETMSSAQIAAQVVTAPYQSQAITVLAPEPRDIVWTNMNQSIMEERLRELLSLVLMFLLLFFWIFPIGTLASLLSLEEVKRVMPWLGELIESNDRLRAIVQHSLPTVAVITLNALLPFILEFFAYLQGSRARSWVEYSIMKRYFLFLFVNVIFIFLLASTYWQVVRDLYESPGKIPEKLATALNQGTAKNYFVCYVILQAFGIMPLQLLNLGVVIPRIVYRLFVTRSPRDFAELNAPPMINYGTVYPQSILIFVITLLYSIIQPLILIFGTLYFGIAYVVYKYKLLFVFYKPYESHGQAWPITFIRAIWGVIVFQLFMTGIFVLRKSFVMASLLGPLIPFTIWWGWYTDKAFRPLSSFASLSSVSEVQRGADTEDVVMLRTGHPVTRSQSNLSRRRYAEHDDTLYVAPEDERTDYSQPPMSNWYYGVLNTGKRRYGHPALTGVLPVPWLPLKKGETLVNRPGENGAQRRRKGKANGEDSALVLTLRRRYSAVRKRSKAVVDTILHPSQSQHRGQLATGPLAPDSTAELSSNPWISSHPTPAPPVPSASYSTDSSDRAQERRLSHRMSWDAASGVMALPEDGDWLEDDSGSEDYGTTSGSGSLGGGTPTEPEPDVSTAPTETLDRLAETSATTSTTPHTPRKRHATYFHHPEKRKSRPALNVMPGEFPR